MMTLIVLSDARKAWSQDLSVHGITSFCQLITNHVTRSFQTPNLIWLLDMIW